MNEPLPGNSDSSPHLRLVRDDAPNPIPFRRPWKTPKALPPEEVQAAMEHSGIPPIMTVDQAAALLQLTPATVYKAVSEDRFKDAVRRGKPLRFWRDRLVSEFFAAR
jgi:hypothetical protein